MLHQILNATLSTRRLFANSDSPFERMDTSMDGDENVECHFATETASVGKGF